MLIGCLTFWPPNQDLSTYPIIGGIHPDDLFCHRDNLAADKLTKRSCACVCVSFVERDRKGTKVLIWTSLRSRQLPLLLFLSLSLTVYLYLSLSQISAFPFWHIAAERKQHIYCPCVCLFGCTCMHVAALGYVSQLFQPIPVSHTETAGGQASILSPQLLCFYEMRR